MKTDKSNYSYGDSIQVYVTISNNSDTSFSIWGSSTCIVRLGFNSIPFQIKCTADDREFIFEPHSSRTWIWVLKPQELEIPTQNGEQVIYGYGPGLKDSITITAPKYYGGILELEYNNDSSSNDIRKIRDSLNARVLYSDTLTALGNIIEQWQISNYSIDSLVNVYSKDSNFMYIEVSRPLQFNKEIVTSVKMHSQLPQKYILYQNYPNPFNPSTTIRYSIPKESFVTLKIYNTLGEEIKTLVNGDRMAGSYEVNFNAEKLASGVYFYRINAGRFTEIKKLILNK